MPSAWQRSLASAKPSSVSPSSPPERRCQELATSIVAALRKQPDIAIGNVIGSNLYNILCILGFSGLLAPLNGPGIKPLDLYVMLGTAALLLPIMWTGFVVRRWEGDCL